MPVTYPAHVEAAFNRFWSAYPHRPVNPRAPALAVFARLLKAGESADALIVAAGRYAAVAKAEKLDPVSIPHARKWLNQRYFDDYMTPDVPAPAEPAQPAPEHPFDWARGHMTTATWTAWFERLELEEIDGAVVIIAPTRFARDRINQEHGHLLRRRYGGVVWRIRGDAA
ncbi:DnaA N-terminal domain-containing protein [Brevundimonas sp.]|uniref:DnaA N-terminal domain-containing protein n=1 Tax=Brevundimonas sp. TaxID=1871086 RepID=UPI003D6D1D87